MWPTAKSILKRLNRKAFDWSRKPWTSLECLGLVTKDLDWSWKPWTSHGSLVLDFATPPWWACLVSEKMRNYEAAFAKHGTDMTSAPEDLSVLPVFRPGAAPEDMEADGTHCVADDIGEDCAAAASMGEADYLGIEAHVDAEQFPRPRARAETQPLAVHCGLLPPGCVLSDYHKPPSKINVRNAEGRYWQGFASQLQSSFPTSDASLDALAVDDSWHLSAAGATEAAQRQTLFFKAVDRYRCDPTLYAPVTTAPKEGTFAVRLDSSMAKLSQQYIQSDTVVMEAAFFLLREGLLNVPDTGRINVKQARALLWNAAWLQEHMGQVWREEGSLTGSRASVAKVDFSEFCLAIIGPAGTGKTAVLKITEALTLFFAGPETVTKLAPGTWFVTISKREWQNNIGRGTWLIVRQRLSSEKPIKQESPPLK